MIMYQSTGATCQKEKRANKEKCIVRPPYISIDRKVAPKSGKKWQKFLTDCLKHDMIDLTNSRGDDEMVDIGDLKSPG